MMQRCYNRSHDNYPYYGGRGITVCDRWVVSFTNFLKDMGERPESCTLGRIDNDLGYFPLNCEWQTIRQQNTNKRNTKYVIYKGSFVLLLDLCKDFDLDYNVVYARLRNGWSLQETLERPVQPKRKNRTKEEIAEERRQKKWVQYLRSLTIDERLEISQWDSR